MHGPRRDTIKEMNAAQAILQPPLDAGLGDRPALLWRGETVTYDDLAANVRRAGNGLRGLGVARGDRVLMLLKDAPNLVYAYLGAIGIGAVAIALNVRASDEDLRHVLRDSGAKLLLIDRDFLPAYEGIAGDFEGALDVLLDDADEGASSELGRLIAGQPADLVPVSMSPRDMAFWIYTSGTTGRLKAAVHLHRSVLNATDYTGGILGVTQGDVLFATSKLFFAYSLGNVLFASFRLGATTVLVDGWPDPKVIAEAIGRYKPDVVFSVPTMYRNMLGAGVTAGDGFDTVRHYVSAGERLPEELWRRWKEATGVEILDGMGTSETIYMLLTNRPGRVRPGSSGTVAPGAKARLADADGCDLEPGEPGILWASIPSRCDRYWNQEAPSRDAFRGEWFRTGDKYWVDDDGYWHHQGRFDDMLKISGQWVSPAEIEEVVLAHTDVRDACVVGVPDSDGLPRTMLFAVPPDGTVDEGALSNSIRDAVIKRLSPYKCPKWIRFIDEVPRTATGKAQRFILRRLLGESAR